jgi:hypothetical protein
MYTLYSTLSMHIKAARSQFFFPLGSVFCQLFSENPRKKFFCSYSIVFTFFIFCALCLVLYF